MGTGRWRTPLGDGGLRFNHMIATRSSWRFPSPCRLPHRSGVLATPFTDGIDQATIFPMRKYNPGYVLARVAVDDDNIGAVLDPAADLVNAVDIQVCVNEDRSLKRQRSVQPKRNLALGLIRRLHR
jgi:hypothetical protein